MRALTINGEPWRVIRVPVGDPRLIDRTGEARLATTNPKDKTICIRDDIMPPLLDKVVLHEVAHAITVSWDMLGPLRSLVPREASVYVEEWAAKLVEDHSIEAIDAASEILGRPVCVRGRCA